MSSPDSLGGRTGSGHLSPAIGDKVAENVASVAEPLYKRPWVRVVALSLFCLAGIVGIGGIAYLSQWRDSQLAEIARQRSCLQAFLASPEFASYVRAMDAQLVGTVNFIAARPKDVHALLPDVAARDKDRRALPWTHQVMPLPISTAADPAAVVRASRELSSLLVRHGHALDETTRLSARQIFIRTLAPFAGQFVRRTPGNAFPALGLDRTMQEDALTAFARLHGASVGIADTERIFAIYAAIGPAMWRAIEQERERTMAASAPKP